MMTIIIITDIVTITVMETSLIRQPRENWPTLAMLRYQRHKHYQFCRREVMSTLAVSIHCACIQELLSQVSRSESDRPTFGDGFKSGVVEAKRAHIYIYIYICMYICMYMYVYLSLSLSLSLYTYICNSISYNINSPIHEVKNPP